MAMYCVQIEVKIPSEVELNLRIDTLDHLVSHDIIIWRSENGQIGVRLSYVICLSVCLQSTSDHGVIAAR